MRARDKVRAGHAADGADRRSPTRRSPASEARELSDDEVLKVLAKEAKKRREAATAYRDAGRPELADNGGGRARRARGLPARAARRRRAERARAPRPSPSTGATGMPQMGQVMKAVQAPWSPAAPRAAGSPPS